MVIKSPYPDIPLPELDLLTYVFGSGVNLSENPLWINAADPTQYLSPRTAMQWIKRFGFGLQKLGLKPGEVVMQISLNHIFVPVAYLGTAGYGFIFSGANPTFTANEMAYQMKNCNTRIILVHPSILPVARKAAKQAGLGDENLFLFSDTPHSPVDGVQDWRSILATHAEVSNHDWPRLSGRSSKQTIAAINYSSGTTGLPKGVMVTHHNIMANVEQIISLRNIENPLKPEDTPEERWVGFLPLYHAYGQIQHIILVAKRSTPVFIMSAFDFEKMLRVIQDHKITFIAMAPPVAVLLSKHPATAKYDISSLTGMSSGGAPLPKSLREDCVNRFGVTFGEGYGMTEATCACIIIPYGISDNTGSVGVILQGSEIKLLDEKGDEVALGEPGEIYYRGPNVSPGYWKNEKATEESMLEGGWLRTGDIAKCDKKGYFWIVDRLKELIKVSGFQVAPAELEAELLKHPAVADAGVIGVKESFHDQEKVRAYVQLKDKNSTTAQDLQEWMKQRVAKHKWLTGGVIFLDAIPKSPSGKIQRKLLREWSKKEAQRAKPKL